MGKLYDKLPDSYLKKVLKDEESELVENLLNIKDQFEREQDKDIKIVYRDRLSSAFWNLYIRIGSKMNEKTSKEKRMLLRFGLLDLKYLSADDQRMILSQNFDEHDEENIVFYVDEWLLEILKGKIKPSMTDESSPRKSSEGGEAAQQQSKMERAGGAMEAEKRNYNASVDRKKILEDALAGLVANITSHPLDHILGGPEPYNDDQIKKIDELVDTSRELKKVDKEMTTSRNLYYDKLEEYKAVESEMSSMQSQGAGQTTYAVDSRTAENEINSVRQMTKMCVGRQGNHFPILTSSLIPKETKDYNFKGNAYAMIRKIEAIDPSIFTRTFRQNTHRIPPYILLTPGYGNFGICWEPYDKYNKATSKGRIAIPIFCRDPKLVLTIGLGDFRWQCAKEMAGYHWMDEGLSGRYYEYISSNRIKGDIKTLFINDYIQWIVKESEGIQKLESQDVRYIFWRFIPFPDSIKQELSNRGFYYQDLYKKELNFLTSKGY